ncbi:MAG: TIGR02680 family protein, partial [Mycobacteriales bacterium]
MSSNISLVSDPKRWVPARAGLIALWRYWDETFTFHQGRLLLRGPNGSGKSMALELLLPFLLDGDSSPNRLTSAGRSRGRLFDRVMTGTNESSRTGFAWVEFRRGAEIFTVGARMRAAQATGKVDVDLFTTTRSVGRDLHLLDPARVPLSRKALIEAIGDTGRVHASAEEHRGAVREVLFPGFSADRYASVITALLALRREKLSANLDLDKLSQVLSEALPPLDEQDVAAVAEGFERLDRRRGELAALERDLAEVHQLARQHRDYARTVVVGLAREVRAAETSRDQVTREERRAREAHERAHAEAIEIEAETRRLAARATQISVEHDALKDSDAYREGASLADLRAHATRLRSLAERAVATTHQRVAASEEAQAEAADCAQTLAAAQTNLTGALRELTGKAEQVGAVPVITEATGLADPDEAERFVGAWLRAQQARVVEVRGALHTHDRAVLARQHAEDALAADEAVAEDRLATRTAAEAAVATARQEYAREVASWAAACSAIPPARLAGRLPRPVEDPAAVRGAIADLAGELQAEQAVARAELAAETQAALAERTELAAERERWARGELVDPQAPTWRSARTGRPGAPLWRLVDLVPQVTDAEVDGVEAALAAAGLLDAWVAPDGRVDLGPDRSDVVLSAQPRPGRTLAALLAPAPQTSVPADVITQVLASIPLVDSISDAGTDVAVGTDGTYRLGSALGRGPRQPAAHLGALARERHRLARLAELDAALAAADARLAELDRRRATLERHRAAIEA